MLSFRAAFDTLRSTTTVGTNYAAIGSPLTSPVLVVTFKNATNGDVIVSTDGTNDKLFMSANSYTVYDIRTNAPYETDFMFAVGTQFYIKDGPTVGTSGTFAIEAVIATQIPGVV